jgi:effector-binding domain-containing protein
MNALKAQGVEAAGPWFTHHLRSSPDIFDLEVCVPTHRSVQPSGRVIARDFPAARMARRVYRGRYEGLGEAWGQFMSWVQASGHLVADDFYECYAAGPESGADTAEWRTELLRPLRT